MTTEIGHIRLHLPGGLERRAGRIGRLLGESLAQEAAPVAGRIDHLAVGPLRIDTRQSDRIIAEQIARSVRIAIGRRQEP